MSTPSVLIFAGSTRAGSYNKKLARLAAAAVSSAGGAATLIDLKDFPMPLFDGDLEDSGGIPEHGLRFKELLRSHQAVLIASPEYNSSITAVLKNALDWASRSASDGEETLSAFKGKVALLMSASPGNLGGLRGLVHLRSILGNIGVLVLPDQLSIPAADKAFLDDGTLREARLAERVKRLAAELVESTKRLMGER